MATGALGFFGKVPAKADFINFGLSVAFVQQWDPWLQHTIAHCRERLGENWQTVFLTSPVWRFVLSPTVCGPSAWAGVMASSIDRVGRAFPLTLAFEMAPSDDPSRLVRDWDHGFDRLIDLALDMLKDDESFEAVVTRLPRVMEGLAVPPVLLRPYIDQTSTDAVYGDTVLISPPPEAGLLEEAMLNQLPRTGIGFTAFWHTGWDAPPMGLVTKGLPDPSRTLSLWELASAHRPPSVP